MCKDAGDGDAALLIRGDELPGETERRGNRWAFLCGYWLGKGFTYAEAASRVGDTHPKTIQGIARRAGLCPPKSRNPQREFVISLSDGEHGILTRRAVAAGIEPIEWIERVASCAAKDDLYSAVTDGRYDPQ